MGNQMTIFDYQHVDDYQYKTLAEIQILSNKAKAIMKQAMEKGLSSEVRDQ